MRGWISIRPGPRSKRGDREFLNAVIWRVRTGVPWRDLPERFGAWKTVYNRFSRWAKRGVWERLFKELAIEVDETGSLLDATIVRAHQDAAGGKGPLLRQDHALPTQSSGPLSRRRFDQDPRGHDDAREAAPRHVDPGTPARGDQGRGAGRARQGQSLYRRLGIRRGTHPRRDPRAA